MQDNPFADLVPAQPQAQRRPLPAPPRVADPAEQERLRLAQEANARAEADQRRQERATAVQEGRFQAEMEDRQRRLDVGPAATAAEGERKAGGFYARALNAERSFSSIDFNPAAPGRQLVQPRGLIGQAVQDVAPNFLNSLPAGIGNSSERQLADQAEREFIAAILRYDSGAAIPPEEFVTQGRIYFPRPGDSPAVLEQKARARQVAIAGLRSAAGTMARLAEEDFARLNAQEDAAPSSNPGSGYDVGLAATVSDDPGAGERLPPGQESVYLGFLASLDRNAPVEQNERAIQAWWEQNAPNLAITNARQVAETIRDGGRLGGVNYGNEDARRIAELEARAQAEGLRAPGSGGFGQTVDAFVRGAADLPTLGFADEIAAAGDTLFRGGTMADNLDYQRFIDRRDSENNPYARIGGQIAGGLVLPFRATSVAGGAREGAAFGGAYGFGSGEGGITDRLSSGAIGAGVGAAGGAAVNALMPRVQRVAERAFSPVNALLNANRARSAAEVNMDVVEAGARQGIPIRQPDARPGVRADFAAVEASRTGNPIVRQALEADAAAVEGRVASLATGTPRDNLQLGEAVQGAISRQRTNAKASIRRLYDIARTQGGNDPVPATRTLQAIEEQIAALRANAPSGSSAEVRVLEGIADDLRQTGLTVDVLQAQRKNLRDRISGAGMDMNADQAMFASVLDGAGDELAASLAQRNARGATALTQANKAHKEQRLFRDQVARLFVGTRNAPADPEMAATRLLSMVTGRGSDNRLSRIWRELEPEEQQDIASTVAQNLGMARNGEFSLATLSTNVNRLLRENPNGLRTLFGADGVRALRDLQIIARAKADTAGELNNSRTAVVSARQELQTMVAGGLGAGLAGIPGMIAGFAARGIGERAVNGRQARLLLSPDFTRWMRQIPDSRNPRVIDRHFARLNTIAARSPVMAADVRALQEYLRSAFQQSPMRAAAESEQEQNSGQIPPQ